MCKIDVIKPFNATTIFKMNRLIKIFKSYLRIILVPFSKYLNCVIAPNGIEISKTNFVHNKMKFIRKEPLFKEELHYKFHPNAKGITEESEITLIQRLVQVRVFSTNGFVVSKKNKILQNNPIENNNSHFLLNNIFIRKVITLEGKSIVLAALGADVNYFHWMTDVLPKIAIAEKAGFHQYNFDNFLISSDDFQFQKITLDHLNIPKQKRVSLSSDKIFYCKELVSPSATCLSGNVSGWIIDFLRQNFKEWMSKDSSSPCRIYIGRKKNT
jgi:hypothetical protein